MYDIICVGGGAAGLTAALYALRAGKTVLVLEKNSFGGQVAFSPKIENWPGTKEMSGLEFADALTEQVLAKGAELELENVVKIEKDGDFRVRTEEGGVYESRAVIISAGVKHRTLGLPGEDELIGNGISFCAVCDGAFYAGQDVALVGGGNSALQEAVLLAETSKSVTILQDLDFLTGEKTLADKLAAMANVKIICGVKVTGYATENGELTGVLVRTKDGKDHRVDCSGVFLAVGLIPENGAFADVVELDAQGYIASDETCETGLPGLFVAGDCRAKRIRQITTASADGAVSALAAIRYIDKVK
ncbi:MAG: FAD-dependent oxidoreductase [Oscillospiraceae bacterium]|nr:FAD-dependent oxidoreductase [Oscillospiraceae bacterium]